MSLCNYTEFFPTCEEKNLLAIIKGITTSSLKLISYTSMPTHTLILIMWVEPFNNFLFHFFNLCFHLSVGGFVCRFICASHECSTCKGRRRALNPQELDLQTALSCHVGAGNQTLGS